MEIKEAYPCRRALGSDSGKNLPRIRPGLPEPPPGFLETFLFFFFLFETPFEEAAFATCGWSVSWETPFRLFALKDMPRRVVSELQEGGSLAVFSLKGP